MHDAATAGPPLNEAQMRSAISQAIAELRALHQQMARDQAEIEALKLRTRQLKAETRAILETLRTA
jgi:hypothetical protein